MALRLLEPKRRTLSREKGRRFKWSIAGERQTEFCFICVKVDCVDAELRRARIVHVFVRFLWDFMVFIQATFCLLCLCLPFAHCAVYKHIFLYIPLSSLCYAAVCLCCALRATIPDSPLCMWECSPCFGCMKRTRTKSICVPSTLFRTPCEFSHCYHTHTHTQHCACVCAHTHPLINSKHNTCKQIRSHVCHFASVYS